MTRSSHLVGSIPVIDELAALRRAQDAESRVAVLTPTLRRLDRRISWDDQYAFREVVTSELDRGNRERARVGLERIDSPLL